MLKRIGEWSVGIRGGATFVVALMGMALVVGCTGAETDGLGGTGMGPPSPSGINGTIWNDAMNPNGNQDSEEPPIGDASISLIMDQNKDGSCAASEPVQATTTSGPDGSYQFESLPDGDYCVDVDTPLTPASGTVDPSAPVTVDSSAANGPQVNMGFTN